VKARYSALQRQREEGRAMAAGPDEAGAAALAAAQKQAARLAARVGPHPSPLGR
jgi:hypothetical protein